MTSLNIILIALFALYAVIRAAIAYDTSSEIDRFQFIISIVLLSIITVASIENIDYV